MKYKLNLPDNSFIIVDNNFEIIVYRRLKKSKVRIINILSNYENYRVKDKNKKVKFNLEETDLDLPIGQRFKFSQDIEIGDLVIGENGQPMKVKELHTGQDEMFEIIIENKSYIVNGNHILHLIDKETNEPLDIPVNVYILMDNEFKSHYAMRRN